MCVLGACRGQKKMLNLLELELQMRVNHHVGAEKKSQILYKSPKYF